MSDPYPIDKFTERWKPILGTDGKYEVSNQGRVRSWVTRGGGHRPSPKILRTPPHYRSGYRNFTCRPGPGGRKKKVSTAVLETFKGPRPAKDHEVSHINGNRQDDRLGNLAWETKKRNQERKAEHGNSLHGGKHPSTDLTSDDVRLIRSLVAVNGVSYRVLAWLFEMSVTGIQNIVEGRRWPKDDSAVLCTVTGYKNRIEP